MRDAFRPLVCGCGRPASFGSGVDLRSGRVGTWRCRDCADAAGQFRNVTKQDGLQSVGNAASKEQEVA